MAVIHSNIFPHTCAHTLTDALSYANGNLDTTPALDHKRNILAEIHQPCLFVFLLRFKITWRRRLAFAADSAVVNRDLHSFSTSVSCQRTEMTRPIRTVTDYIQHAGNGNGIVVCASVGVLGGPFLFLVMLSFLLSAGPKCQAS